MIKIIDLTRQTYKKKSSPFLLGYQTLQVKISNLNHERKK